MSIPMNLTIPFPCLNEKMTSLGKVYNGVAASLSPAVGSRRKSRACPCSATGNSGKVEIIKSQGDVYEPSPAMLREGLRRHTARFSPNTHLP